MDTRERIVRWAAGAAACVLVFSAAAPAQDDPYEKYVQTSRDFQPVKQDKPWCLKAFPSWTYMPWSYQWTIGYTDESGRWSQRQGYNGAFIDWDRIESSSSKTGKLDWINQFQLRFYVDHAAGKRYLHLWDGGESKPYLNQIHGNGVRVKPVNAAMADTLKGLLKKHIETVKSSPYRAAYALDDEISWGHFIHPCMWRVTDDKAAYPAWLKEVYGPGAPAGDKWITYGDLMPRLRQWTVGQFDASGLLDQWTFNDAWWANFLGDLVAYANSIDPATPCGFVGGQAPNAFGGYDYARLMRKVQFIESYNLGSSQAIIRSFNPRNAIPSVTTHFHKSVEDTVWQTWYYLAHGNRGFIGWVEGWFDGKTPKGWHEQVAPHYREAGGRIGPLLAGAEWIHDGVAIYYSHPSIQLGWILDAEAHGRTWINRNGDEKLGASHLVRRAWENMLRDEGIQYNFLSYVDVIQKGVPAEYKVLILPACLCLSDVEVRRITEFCRKGGTVIADYLPGLWDQHGRGRPAGGALDGLFGVRHDPRMRAADLFGGKLWCEVDQDVNFSYKSYEQFLTRGNTCVKDASGFNKAVRAMEVNHVQRVAGILPARGEGSLPVRVSPLRVAGILPARTEGVPPSASSRAGDLPGPPAAAGQEPRRAAATAPAGPAAPPAQGEAVLMNLSPQWYNAYRVAGFEAAKKRDVFMAHVLQAGVKRWVSIKNAGPREFGYEITYWSKDGRTIVFVCSNPETTGTQTGGGNSVGLKTDVVPITLEFAEAVKSARDERTGKDLGDGKEFSFQWRMNEAVVMSFAGPPPGQP